MLTHTYTKTYALLDPWAQTLPWECLVRPTNCCSADHDHSPMVNDPCAADGCDEPLLAGETCYGVGPNKAGPPPQKPNGPVRSRPQWVCWRHVHPDDGPRTI